MSGKPPKRAAIGEKGQSKRPPSRSRLVYDEPHVFRVKSERSLSHLQESQHFHPCIACSKESHRRHEGLERPHSSYIRQRSTPPPQTSEHQRPSTATKKCSRLPPTSADLERLSRPKIIPPQQPSNNCNWNNFIKKKSKYGKTKLIFRDSKSS
jgi:hypothetical protein